MKTTVLQLQCSSITSKGRIEHLEIQYFKMCEHIKENQFRIVQVPTVAQLADLLTKPLIEELFTHL